MADIHKASSESWGREACARLCQIVLEANTGVAQQIQESRTDLLDILTKEQLSEPCDDLGLTLPFLAVYYDRPEMLEYLHKRGVDLTAPCDPMLYGTPMFYAISLEKTRLIEQLDGYGCDLNKPCDAMSELPIAHAQRVDNPFITREVRRCAGKVERARVLLQKHVLRIRDRRRFLAMLKSIPLLQRVARGMLSRRRVSIIRAEQKKARRVAKMLANIELESDDDDEGEDGD